MIPADVINIIIDYAWDYTDFKDFVDIKKVHWRILSGNPNAIHILEKNLDKVDWWILSSNPNAIHILEKNLDKVEWNCLSRNPNIFKDNKKELKSLLLQTI